MNSGHMQGVNRCVSDAIVAGAFPGAVIAIAKDGVVVYQGSFGRTTWGEIGTPVTLSTCYDLASITKVVVATAAVSLLDEQGLSLDQPLLNVLPELRKTPHGTVTFRQVLEHTSGQPRRFSRPMEAEAAFALRAEPAGARNEEERHHRIRRLLDDLSDVELLFRPGARVHYTSIGFFLLGVAMERLTGTRLDTVLRARVLQRLGTLDLNFVEPNKVISGKKLKGIAPTENCVWRGGLVHGRVHDEIAAYLGGIAGHAGLFGTAQAVLQFGLATLERPGRLFSQTLMDASTTVQTTTLEGENRGWGWLVWTPTSFMGDVVSQRSYGHTGFTGTSLLVDPDNDLVVVLLANRVHPNRRNNAIFAFRRRFHDTVAREFAISR